MDDEEIAEVGNEHECVVMANPNYCLNQLESQDLLGTPVQMISQNISQNMKMVGKLDLQREETTLQSNTTESMIKGEECQEMSIEMIKTDFVTEQRRKVRSVWQ